MTGEEMRSSDSQIDKLRKEVKGYLKISFPRTGEEYAAYANENMQAQQQKALHYIAVLTDLQKRGEGDDDWAGTDIDEDALFFFPGRAGHAPVLLPRTGTPRDFLEHVAEYLGVESAAARNVKEKAEARGVAMLRVILASQTLDELRGAQSQLNAIPQGLRDSPILTEQGEVFLKDAINLKALELIEKLSRVDVSGNVVTTFTQFEAYKALVNGHKFWPARNVSIEERSAPGFVDPSRRRAHEIVKQCLLRVAATAIENAPSKESLQGIEEVLKEYTFEKVQGVVFVTHKELSDLKRKIVARKDDFSRGVSI